MNNTKPSDVSEVKNNAESKLLLDPTITKSPTSSILQNGTNRPATVRCVDDVLRELPITDDTSCGIWSLRGPNLQRFATKNAYVFLYGLLGCISSASNPYFSGTITTMEKRFKIPSTTTGFIMVGNDISQLLISIVMAYYAGRGHRPRWVAFGIYTIAFFCCLSMLPHFLYGSGDEALNLTKEYGSSTGSLNSSLLLPSQDKNQKLLCLDNEHRDDDWEEQEMNMIPPMILFVGQLVSGIGGSLYYTAGVSYMDDNTQKSKVPALISFSYFLKMLGPVIGYALASFTLKIYISPNLTPTITNNDPRWLGAWWLGWIILALLLFIFASIIALFPKTLPRAAARKVLALERSRSTTTTSFTKKVNLDENPLPASLKDMLQTFMLLLSNKTLMCINIAAVFYFLGYSPYWMLMAKYIETQYLQSASFSSLIAGVVGLVFNALGVLVSGFVISKVKPKARWLAAWNITVAIISIMGMISFAFLKCTANDNLVIMSGINDAQSACNDNCNCDYVTYNPVCSDDGRTFISACHAGCKTLEVNLDGTKTYSNCTCITPTNRTNFTGISNGTASSGPCPVSCQHALYWFLVVVCVLKFTTASGRASNFLISLRCVKEKDKPMAMAMGLTMMSLFAFIPSPILFGYIFDKTCVIWGKTRAGTGNCWLYDVERLRYALNLTAAGFVTIGTLFDIVVWYYAKDVKIFDEETETDAPKGNQPVVEA